MTTILGIDPGGTPVASGSRSATGWSMWYFDPITPPRPIAHGQVQGDERVFIAWFRDTMPQVLIGQPDEVVCESFQDDGRTQFPDTTPLQIEGALKVMRPDTIFQPNTMKSAMPNAKVKALGLWWKGEPHAVDSGRHVFALLRERLHYPTLMLWPARVAGGAAPSGGF